MTIAKVYYWLASLVIIIIAMIYGQFVIIPLLFGTLLAVLLNPAIHWVRRLVKSHTVSFFIVISGLIAILTAVGAGIYLQMKSVFSQLEIEDLDIDKVKNEIVTMMPDILGQNLDSNNLIENGAQRILSLTSNLIQSLVGSGGNILYILGMAIIFSYFFSINYLNIKNVVFDEVSLKRQHRLQAILSEIPIVTRSYMQGMGIVMVILAIINSLAFWAIGLDFAWLWGALIGLLAIIPYLGSFIGLLLPLSYSFIQSDDLTQPLMVLGVFLVIQQIEGNVLTPKIVGDKVNVDPLLVIIFMLIFGKIWGVMGVILSLPIAGSIRVIMDQYRDTKMWATLMANHHDSSEE